MPAIVRPDRKVSFTEAARNNRGQIPADQLDAQIHNLIQAIHSTQEALADLRRDDGRLKNASVGIEQLATVVEQKFTHDVREHTLKAATRAEQSAAQVKHAENNIALYAQDAEAAAVSASQFLAAVNAAERIITNQTNRVVTLTDTVDAQTTDAENWANASQAWATNAQTDEQQAAAWAEYLAGPVVNSADAPAYISDTPWGHGLYYQPVEGYGGMGGLWSAKWWAIYAAQLVGPWGFYYLGGWPAPPLPGSSNPATGVKVPDPLLPGSFYYDTTTGEIYVWDGTQWKSPYALASGALSKFVYVSTAGQTVFSGPDNFSKTPAVGLSPSDVHLNGVRLVEALDFNVNASTSTLTLVVPATVNSIVQWDLLVPPDDLVPGNVHNFKVALTPSAPDGTNKVFTMQYTHPTSGPQPVNVTDGAQLQVSVDGIIQEPAADYSGATNTLTFAVAPPANAHFWVVWFSNAVLTS